MVTAVVQQTPLVRLDRMGVSLKIGPHTSVSLRPQSHSHPLTTSDMHPFDPLVRSQTHKSCGRRSSLGDLASLNRGTLHNPEIIAYSKVKAPQEINKDPYIPTQCEVFHVIDRWLVDKF